MERIWEHGGPQPEQEALHPVPADVGQLETLLRRAPKVSGGARRQLADSINDAFDRLRRVGGSRSLADFIERELEGHALENLVDSEGRTCRAVAAESLISMGFPYALEVTPDDLEHLREDERPPKLNIPASASLGLVTLACAYEMWSGLPEGEVSQRWLPLIPLHIFVSLSITLVAGLTRSQSRARRRMRQVALGCGIIGIALSVFGAIPTALLGYAMVAVYAFLASPRK